MTIMDRLQYHAPPALPGEAALREEVREFLDVELADRPSHERAQSWNGYDEDFTRRLGERGWLGMTWPRRYGGHERSALERYVVIEELLAAGAPVLAHWTADRQTGPLLLGYGTEAQRQAVLPGVAAGTLRIAIGMSEPNSGSDLASIQTRARPVDGGFVVNGSKIWTTIAHRAHYLVLLCRTDGESGDRHGGLSQLLVDMTTPGIEARAIRDMTGAEHFSEVVFTDAFVPESAVIGQRGNGWAQVMSELASERSGPERFLSAFALIEELARLVRASPTPDSLRKIGRITAHVAVLRRLSFAVAGMLDRGEDPTLQASVVKDLGAVLEQEIPDIARSVMAGASDADAEMLATLGVTLIQSPCFSLRGGTREILRGIIARGLGLR